jgi:alkylation response protein AidB-like acyl-CoA dehydrogenase
MTTTRDDLLAMAAALRKALGAGVEGGAAPDPGWRARWPVLAGLGLAGLCAAPDRGGFGAEVPAALVAARELGAALDGSPYPAMVAASYALTRWLAPELGEEIADAVISGAHVPTLACLDSAATVAEHSGGLRVTGRAHVVAAPAAADSFLVLPSGGDALLFIRRDETCTVTGGRELDVTREVGEVAFDGAPAVPLAVPPGGRPLVERLHGLLLAGDTLGGASRMLDRTVAYAAGRMAFGKAIGGQQAVQHRLVDHTIRLRGMSLLADEAATGLARGAEGAGRAVALAEASVAGGGLTLLHDLVQLTGAIGFTWEYGLHLYERRAHVNARLGRNPRRARRLLAEQAGWRS